MDLDTSIMPDVFGLRVFDRSELVVRVLPGDFSNTIRMLAFHDILIEEYAGVLHQVIGIWEFDLAEETLVIVSVCGHASSSGRDGDTLPCL